MAKCWLERKKIIQGVQEDKGERDEGRDSKCNRAKEKEDLGVIIDNEHDRKIKKANSTVEIIMTFMKGT